MSLAGELRCLAAHRLTGKSVKTLKDALYHLRQGRSKAYATGQHKFDQLNAAVSLLNHLDGIWVEQVKDLFGEALDVVIPTQETLVGDVCMKDTQPAISEDDEDMPGLNFWCAESQLGENNGDARPVPQHTDLRGGVSPAPCTSMLTSPLPTTPAPTSPVQRPGKPVKQYVVDAGINANESYEDTVVAALELKTSKLESLSAGLRHDLDAMPDLLCSNLIAECQRMIASQMNDILTPFGSTINGQIAELGKAVSDLQILRGGQEKGKESERPPLQRPGGKTKNK